MRTTALLLSYTALLLPAALAQDAYGSASAPANVTMTTILPPANCTSACTTIIEPCSETPAGPAGTAGTGVIPSATASGTYYSPSGPSATSSGAGGEGALPAGYTGAAAAVQVGGLLMAFAGGLAALV
jgi:hypothetical protein